MTSSMTPAVRTTSGKGPLVTRVMGYVPAAVALVFVGLYAYTSVQRLTFPFDLEWEEGAFVDHVQRLVQHQALYVPPTLDFIPFVYTPGYYYVSALAAMVGGVNVVTLRLMSILCSFAAFAVLTAFAHRERGSWREGITVAGLFAATYVIGGAWFDVARVDSLFLLLTFGALYLVRFGDTTAALVGAGLMGAAAVLTKQVALILAPILLLYPLLRLGKRGVIPGAVFVASVATAIVAFEWLNDGWFLYYTFRTLTHTQAVFVNRLASFWTTDLFLAFPIGTVLGLAWCVAARRFASFEEWTFYLVAGVAFLVSTWETRIHPGAWVNTMLPAYAFLAIAATRAAAVLDARAHGLGKALVIAQMLLLVYQPGRYIPSADDREAAGRLVDYLRTVPGEVLMLDHGYFPSLAGKRTHAHEMAVRDVLLNDDDWAHGLSREIRQSLEEHRFDVVVQDTPDYFPVPLGRYYRKVDSVHESPDVLWPPTGHRSRPEYIYVPRR